MENISWAQVTFLGAGIARAGLLARQGVDDARNEIHETSHEIQRPAWLQVQTVRVIAPGVPLLRRRARLLVRRQQLRGVEGPPCVAILS